jgi:hypothetical protein
LDQLPEVRESVVPEFKKLYRELLAKLQSGA